MIAPARVAAYEVLHAVNARRTDLPHALAAARAGLADERDRALAGEIATGSLRWQGAFDHIVQATSGRSLSRFDSEVLDVLRMTMFQLLHLDRVPASAAVNDAVSLTRRAGKRSAAPLVNALLRRVSRERQQLPLPGRPADGSDRAAALDYLTTTLSHPGWLAARWLDRHGLDAAESWMTFDNSPALLTLRANVLKTSVPALADDLRSHGVETDPCRFAPHGLVVRRGNPLATPLSSQGLFIVQDEASQLVSDVAGARPGERVLDACASPGGKTLGMAASMLDKGALVATDLRGARVDLLARTIRQSGATVVRVVRADASRPLPFAPRFDLVLLDAPCSGLGTVRRDPDIKWRRTEDDFPALTDAQTRMLEETAVVIRPGGRLVYSTCSSEPEENEMVVSRFLARHPEFEASPARAAGRFVDGSGHFRTLPFRDGLEAFFAAVLVKRDVQQ